MLSRINRLPSSEILHVMRRGKRIVGDALQIVVQKSEADVSRFACIISTKIDKRATRRNRMKRLVSESITHLLPRLHNPVDCIVIARKDFSGMRQTEAEAMVADLLHV